jgi:hypothetical protein
MEVLGETTKRFPVYRAVPRDDIGDEHVDSERMGVMGVKEFV